MGKGRKPCCDKEGVKKGPWSEAEDLKLISFIQKHGHSNWRALPKLAGLTRCGKSCRLRWVNYLRPDLKRGNFSSQEEETIIKLHEMLGNRWSKIASHFAGRTDNEIKNVWNTHLKKRVKAKNPSTNSPVSSNNSTTDSCLNQALDGTNEYCSTQLMHQTSVKEDIVEHSSSSSSDQQMGDHSPISILTECQREEIVVDESLMDQLVEIPFEPDLDVWNLLDDECRSTSADTETGFSEPHQAPACPLSEIDHKEGGGDSWWWLVYLENELGLDHDQPISLSPTNYTYN